MRKLIIITIILGSLFMLAACEPEIEETERIHTFSFYDYMDTFITVSLFSSSEDEAKIHETNIAEIFNMYHDLSTSYDELDEESTYLENVYSINNSIGEKLEIDKELYDLIAYAEETKALTNGYFDVSIGKAVDVWKTLMNTAKSTNEFHIGDSVFVYHYYDGKKEAKNKIIVNQTGTITSIQRDVDDEDIVLNITLNVGEKTLVIDKNDAYEKELSSISYQKALDDVSLLDFSENEIILTHENDKYYIMINGKDIKLDLGAIAKGYATEKAYDYIKSKKITYYSITSGSSSIILGENINRPDEEYIYRVSLANPAKTEFTDKDTYGTINVKNLSVTTSGNYEQYILHKGHRYHHIVSPNEKMPVQYYHTVTVLGQNAGLLDAISTALFSMSPEVLELWLLEYQDLLNLELIIFNQDGTITTYLKDTKFKEH